MRKLAIAIALISALAVVDCAAQQLQASTYMEHTHVSPKLGTAIGYQFGGIYPFEVGGFYQRSTVVLEAEAGRPLTSENEFYGAFFAYPLLNRKFTSLKLNVRTGVSNGENFVITPGLLADVKLLKNIAIGGGVGVRSFRPTFLASLKINLTGSNRRGSFLTLNN